MSTKPKVAPGALADVRSIGPFLRALTDEASTRRRARYRPLIASLECDLVEMQVDGQPSDRLSVSFWSRSLMLPPVAGKTIRAVGCQSDSAVGPALAFLTCEDWITFDERMAGF
jgi:hypothetical protein